jgi:putative sigma-54 modulation protein
MKINIKATNIELTEAIRDYALRRFSKLEKFLGDKDTVLSIELGKTSDHHKSGDIFRAEVRLSGAGLNHYMARESSDLYASIDEVENEIVQEVTKDKSKKRELVRRGQRAIKNMIQGFPWIKWRK